MCRKGSFAGPDGRPAEARQDREGGEFWLWLPLAKPEQTTRHEPAGDTQIASLDQRHRVYTEAESHLTLSAADRDFLLGKGVDRQDLRVFFSLDREARKVASRIADLFPYWQQVPGFFVNEHGRASICGASGILFGARDMAGRIQAWRVRPYKPADPGSKYLWLSSSARGGPKSGAPASFWPVEGASTSRVRLAEGEIKGLIAARRTGVPTISGGAGIASLGGRQVEDWLSELGPTEVLLAPDSDATTNKSVNRAVRGVIARLLALSRVLGFTLKVEVWDPPSKGIDDALVAGQPIEEVAAEDYLAFLPELPSESEPGKGEGPAPQQAPLLESALLAMADRTEGGQDGTGFNRSDWARLPAHVETVRAGGRIEQVNRARVAKILYKYAAQLLEVGVNINTLAAEERRLADEAKPKLKSKSGGSDEPTQAEKLLNLAEDWTLLIYDGQAYASVVTKNADGTSRRDTLRFSRAGARQKLQHLYYLEYGAPPSGEALAAAMATLEAKAEFEGAHARVWIRTAYQDGRVYLDLADELGRAVVVSETGWEVTNDPPVYFSRTKAMLPLPEPVRGGSLTELQEFVNLDQQGFILCLAWLVHALFPEDPHPILLLEGGQGCGKSSLARRLRSLFDPSSTALRKAPKDDEDIAIAACNNWVLIYDNLGRIPGLISDALCGVATGSGHARRAHYSNDEEASFSFLRPVILTALPGLSGKSDLAERILKVEPPTIPEDSRKLESELTGNGAWEEARPRILGALLDAVSCALRNAGRKRLARLPRLADFAQFVVNAEDALPFNTAEFLHAFDESRRDQVEGQLEADPVASAVRTLVGLNGTWEGTIADLSERLGKLTTDAKSFPNVRHMGIRLRLAEANLRAVGIGIRFHRSHGKRTIHLSPLKVGGDLMAPDDTRAPKPDSIAFSRVPSGVPSGAIDFDSGEFDGTRSDDPELEAVLTEGLI